MSVYSYCEHNDGRGVDWHEIIRRLRIADYDTFDLQQWQTYARSWVTCAVGNQCAIIPRTTRDIHSVSNIGTPLDAQLRDLGQAFSDCFEHLVDKAENDCDVECEIDGLEDYLEAIEQRSAILIESELQARRAEVFA